MSDLNPVPPTVQSNAYTSNMCMIANTAKILRRTWKWWVNLWWWRDPISIVTAAIDAELHEEPLYDWLEEQFVALERVVREREQWARDEQHFKEMVTERARKMERVTSMLQPNDALRDAYREYAAGMFYRSPSQYAQQMQNIGQPPYLNQLYQMQHDQQRYKHDMKNLLRQFGLS